MHTRRLVALVRPLSAVVPTSLGAHVGRSTTPTRSHVSHALQHGQAGKRRPDEEAKRDSRLGGAAVVSAVAAGDAHGQGDGAREPEQRRHGEQAQGDDGVVQLGDDDGDDGDVDEDEDGPDGVEEHEVDGGGPAASFTGHCAHYIVSRISVNLG